MQEVKLYTQNPTKMLLNTRGTASNVYLVIWIRSPKVWTGRLRNDWDGPGNESYSRLETGNEYRVERYSCAPTRRLLPYSENPGMLLMLFREVP